MVCGCLDIGIKTQRHTKYRLFVRFFGANSPFRLKVGHFPIISLEKGINPVHTEHQEASGTLGRTKRPKIKEPEAGSSGALLEKRNESGARRDLRLPQGDARSWTPSDGTDGGPGSGSSRVRRILFYAQRWARWRRAAPWRQRHSGANTT